MFAWIFSRSCPSRSASAAAVLARDTRETMERRHRSHLEQARLSAESNLQNARDDGADRGLGSERRAFSCERRVCVPCTLIACPIASNRGYLQRCMGFALRTTETDVHVAVRFALTCNVCNGDTVLSSLRRFTHSSQNRSIWEDLRTMICADGLVAARSSLSFPMFALSRASVYVTTGACGAGAFRREQKPTAKDTYDNTTLLLAEKPEAEVRAWIGLDVVISACLAPLGPDL